MVIKYKGINSSVTSRLGLRKRRVSMISVGRNTISGLTGSLSILNVRKGNTACSILVRTNTRCTSLLVTTATESRVGLCSYLVTGTTNIARAVTEIHGPRCAGSLCEVGRRLNLSVTVGPRRATTGRVDHLLEFSNTLRVSSFSGNIIRLVGMAMPRGSSVIKATLDEISGLENGIEVYAIREKSRVFVPGNSFIVGNNSEVSIITGPRVTTGFFGHVDVTVNEDGSIVLLNNNGISFCLTGALVGSNTGIGVVRGGPRHYGFLSRTVPRTIVVRNSYVSRSLLLSRNIRRTSNVTTLVSCSRRGVVVAVCLGNVAGTGLVAGMGGTSFSPLLRSRGFRYVVRPGDLANRCVTECVETVRGANSDGIRSLCHLGSSGIRTLRFGIGTRSEIAGIPVVGLGLGTGLRVVYVGENKGVVLPRNASIVGPRSAMVILAVRGNLDGLRSVMGH